MDLSLEMLYRKVQAKDLSISTGLAAVVAFSVVSGLQFLTDKWDVKHRQVKPSNIFLSREGNIKVGDFRIGGRPTLSRTPSQNALRLPYVAPETVDPRLRQSNEYDIRSDVWSLGITLIEIATGTHPYAKWVNPIKRLQEILEGDPPSLPDNVKFDESFRNFVCVCCRKNLTDRPRYDELLLHPFLQRTQLCSTRGVAAFVEDVLTN